MMKSSWRARIVLPAFLGMLAFLLVGAHSTLFAEDAGPAIKEQSSARAFLGVVPRKLDHVMRAALGFEEPGVLLADVVRDTAAEDAGLQVGDLLLSVDGTPIHDPDRLMQVMKKYRAGDAAELQIQRQGKRKKLDVTFGQRPQRTEFFGDMDWQEDLQLGLKDLHSGLRDLHVGLRDLDSEVRVFSTDDDGEVIIETEHEPHFD